MLGRRDPFTEWDAAYVLGALTPAERRDYEEHLSGCVRCATAVAELAGMPGMFARVPQDDGRRPAVPAVSAEPPAPRAASGPDQAALSRIIATAHRRRVRRRIWALTVGVAAAALVAAIALILPTMAGSTAAPTLVAMKTVHASPLTAEVRLVAEPWGTRIEATCSLARSALAPAPTAAAVATAPPGSAGASAAQAAAKSVGDYRISVTDRAGKRTQLATWRERPGVTATPTATTSLKRSEIVSIEIDTTGGTVLLRGRMP
ncbi:zf-HC2 domain-containing protein [Microbacterium sp. STN6]|uniref:anti-sigma factor family protein n=1 Tax=Microbacterium sp. STN6 TaxID=2995588 RepID=UPI002260FA86|nr:zf-HC2 domain-containing protein [Microbacterium sp. STN6]MCX7522194.1 zf-HC2 domain-containing protein [Microbacterium sp. STN6]